MIDLEAYKPKPTIFKSIFAAHGITTGTVANYLGFSYPYTSNLLNGHYRMPEEVYNKLMLLVQQLEQEDADKPHALMAERSPCNNCPHNEQAQSV